MPPYKNIRGGSWDSGLNGAHTAGRHNYNPANCDVDLGFRVVCSSLEGDKADAAKRQEKVK